MTSPEGALDFFLNLNVPFLIGTALWFRLNHAYHKGRF
eukprot:CAMPEP_0197733760 /NCGR_PEP_ID=MMETSP1434-20131217/44073_1 /TAXON_ID=265543 /ORGANISM="Minutocellus polymorphus, Strain CCMP3303" /LENGTH=37 /DNA_ID= /DNA_START= /DNA_END= /DNA_ORIENTATION=